MGGVFNHRSGSIKLLLSIDLGETAAARVSSDLANRTHRYKRLRRAYLQCVLGSWRVGTEKNIRSVGSISSHKRDKGTKNLNASCALLRSRLHDRDQRAMQVYSVELPHFLIL